MSDVVSGAHAHAKIETIHLSTTIGERCGCCRCRIRGYWFCEILTEISLYMRMCMCCRKTQQQQMPNRIQFGRCRSFLFDAIVSNDFPQKAILYRVITHKYCSWKCRHNIQFWCHHRPSLRWITRFVPRVGPTIEGAHISEQIAASPVL